ncbi:MAG: hypothetical protein GKS03_00185 [Alphaproteobacteria bacterium]|nr:hypothetical protein [Alphaproteobacteria bacterium]
MSDSKKKNRTKLTIALVSWIFATGVVTAIVVPAYNEYRGLAGRSEFDLIAEQAARQDAITERLRLEQSAKRTEIVDLTYDFSQKYNEFRGDINLLNADQPLPKSYSIYFDGLSIQIGRLRNLNNVTNALGSAPFPGMDEKLETILSDIDSLRTIRSTEGHEACLEKADAVFLLLEDLIESIEATMAEEPLVKSSSNMMLQNFSLISRAHAQDVEPAERSESIIGIVKSEISDSGFWKFALVGLAVVALVICSSVFYIETDKNRERKAFIGLTHLGTFIVGAVF